MGKLISVKLAGKPYIGRFTEPHMGWACVSVRMTGKQILKAFKRSGSKYIENDWVMMVEGIPYYSGNYSSIRTGKKYEVYIDCFTGQVTVSRLD